MIYCKIVVSPVLMYWRYHSLYPSDNDAGWNSTQHPRWPRALSEEFDPVIDNWWMGLWCFGACRYWGKFINKCVAEPQLWSGKMTELSMRGTTGWCWVEIISTQHPEEKFGTDISLSRASHDFISHLLRQNCNNCRYSWLKLWKTNLMLLTGMPWLTNFCAPPWWMLGGTSPSITDWGVSLTLRLQYSKHIITTLCLQLPSWCHAIP